jgi:Arc/MetJ-type ribon-helix-helix transcriptional regulator
MQLRFTNPALERFIDSKIKSGQFPSPEAVIEDALSRMMEEEIALSNEDMAAIRESDEQIDRGKSVDFDTFAAEVRKKYGIK